jgi:hypothetical protein
MVMTKGSPDIEFPLLENGLDFMWSAVEHLGTDSSKRSLKYAVLHLAAGIELIMKERLRRESWKLVFENPEKADERAYKRGAFKSVGLKDAIDRLESECDVQFKESARRRLFVFQYKRNRIQHFNMVDSASAITATTAEALEVIVDFIGNELGNDKLTESEDKLLKHIRTKMGRLEEFVSVRGKSIRAKLKTAYTVLSCPSCQQVALTVDDGVECLFCRYKAEGNDAASDYATDVLGVTWRELKDGADWPVDFCAACDWNACVETGEDGPNGYVCFQCGERWAMGKLDECGRCGQWIDSDKNDSGVCDRCIAEQLRRSD